MAGDDGLAQPSSSTPLFGSMPWPMPMVFAGVAILILVTMWFFAKKRDDAETDDEEDEDDFPPPRTNRKTAPDGPGHQPPREVVSPPAPRVSTADMDPQELWQGFVDGERDAGIPRVSGPTSRPPPPPDEIGEDAIWNRQIARGQSIRSSARKAASPVRRSDMGLPPSF